MRMFEALPVVICNPEGAFLAQFGSDWGFTSNSARAHIFDYHADQVAVQLKQARREFGVAWSAQPVDLQLAGERCDDCDRTVHAFQAHFDGSRFRCPACTSSPSREAV